MNKLNAWSAIGALAAAAAAIGLTGCGSGSGDSSGNASVRVANATLSHPSLDLLVNSAATAKATAADSVSAYVAPPSGTVTFQLNDAGAATSLATSTPTLAGGGHYTLVAYESGGAVKTLVIGEDIVAPAAGVATLRVYDAAVEAGKLDVYVTTGACTTANLSSLAPLTTFGALTGPASVTLPAQGAGSYNVCVTGAGSKTDLRLGMPITLAGLQIATVVLTPTVGGQLVNGALLTQQGTYAATRNTNARVRLAASVSNGASVAATSSGGTVIDGGSVAPAFGFYVLVPARDSLNITVNGQTLGAPSATLAAGGDATLLVYGAPGSAVASLIVDDNRLPSDATTTKLRVINGVTGAPAGSTITLTANSAPVGINLAQSAASSYVTVPSSINAVNLTLSSSSAGTFAANTSNTLNANLVYTILVGGPLSAPQLLIR